MNARRWPNFTGVQKRSCALRPQKRPFRLESQPPQKKPTTMAKSGRMGTTNRPQKSRIRNQRLQTWGCHELHLASLQIRVISFRHENMSLWQQNRLESSNGLTRCMETTLKETRTNTIDTIRTSVTLLRSVSHLRMRLKKSSVTDTFRIMLTLREPDRRMKHQRQSHHMKSWQSLAAPLCQWNVGGPSMICLGNEVKAAH